MHINHFRRLPATVGIAFSGGVDSVVLLHTAVELGRNVTMIHYDHGNEYAATELAFARKTADLYGVPIHVEYSRGSADTEQDWRRERKKFFYSLDMTVATGHHLNDAAEWYLLSAIRYEPRVMPYATANLIKPLIVTSKEDILEYAHANKLEFLEDPTNSDVEFNSRNRVRHNILPEALKINPGLLTMVKNRIIENNS